MLHQLRRTITSKVPNLKAASFRQLSEFGNPTDIITHPPTVATQFPFHLDAFLFGQPPDPIEALKCHENFQIALSQISGAKVWSIYEILEKLSSKELRNILIQTSEINFHIDTDVPLEPLRKKISPEYIDYSLSNLSKHDLLDLILLNPSVSISVDNSSTGFSCKTIPVSPLSNMLFTRDQQIATAKGVVIGRFNAIQRTAETALMSAVLPLIGVEPVGHVHEPGHLEGGDFIPLDSTTAFLGIGLRTTDDAARQLMKNDFIGTKRLILVEDQYDLSNNRAHLDTLFNLIDRNTCVCLKETAEDSGNYMRIARIFEKEENGYIEKCSLPFGKFLENEGFKVIKCTLEQQESHFPNFLNLGKDSHGRVKIITSNKDFKEVMKENDANTDVFFIDFSTITSMSGGPHSSAFVLRKDSL